jgi:hypothetical protein
MRSSSPSCSLLRATVWLYLGPIIAIGVLVLFVLGFSVLTLAIHLAAAMLNHAGI